MSCTSSIARAISPGDTWTSRRWWPLPGDWRWRWAARGLLLTSQRILLRSRWFAFAVVVAALIVMPNVIWQWQNGWPTREFIANVRASGKNVPVNPFIFFFQQYVAAGVFAIGFWLSGLW